MKGPLPRLNKVKCHACAVDLAVVLGGKLRVFAVLAEVNSPIEPLGSRGRPNERPERPEDLRQT
jgi:hypothetical protein